MLQCVTAENPPPVSADWAATGDEPCPTSPSAAAT